MNKAEIKTQVMARLDRAVSRIAHTPSLRVVNEDNSATEVYLSPLGRKLGRKGADFDLIEESFGLIDEEGIIAQPGSVIHRLDAQQRVVSRQRVPRRGDWLNVPWEHKT
jgi:hypothetical protein